MTYKEHYEYLEANDHNDPTFIQWKGTDVCIDIHCPKCGYHSHFDGDFMYYFECPSCHKLFAMGTSVRLIDLPPEHVAFVKEDRPNVIRSEFLGMENELDKMIDENENIEN